MQKAAKAVLWIARIWGTPIVAFVLFFGVAHLFGQEEAGAGFRGARDVVSFMLFPIAAPLGLAIALKWEGLGGCITTLASVVHFVIRPDLLFDPFLFWGLMPPGLLYVTYWLMSRRTEAKPDEQDESERDAG